ncbi:unnamed protein product [Nyctereutes procyonoides]|uniref:(raccoon dog) hypothetical protein n=1 Tax=Nyctereutes procyonoides TaxID=34880 RepID=A0A811YNJ1_NYCPR|nr:unnamed protein product [Nyctereutes procyonoides]
MLSWLWTLCTPGLLFLCWLAVAAMRTLNPKAEVARAQMALAVNISAAQDMLRTNLGPKGTMKMLVSDARDINLTKDSSVLLHEMQIQYPIASLIAKVATAQDDITGDAAKEKALQFLEQVKVSKEMGLKTHINVARTSILDSILGIKKQDELLDLFMLRSVEDAYILMCSCGKKLVKAERNFIEDRVKKNRTEKVCGIDIFSLNLTLACGGVALNSSADLNPDCFRHAGLKSNNPHSITLLKGPNKHTFTQRCNKGWHKDCARAVEVEITEALVKAQCKRQGPAWSSNNSGFELQETWAEHSESDLLVGVNLNTGEPCCTVVATIILLVDEIMRTGTSSLKG